VELDAKIQFYLQHRRQIEAWHNIKKGVPKVAHAFFSSLAPDVQQLADELGVKTYLQTGSRWPKLFLYRAAWHSAEQKRPRIAIGLEWQSNTVQFHGSYSGIWHDKLQPGAKALRDAVKDAVKPLPAYRGFKADAYWPAWITETPTDEFWVNLPAFKASLIERIRGRWTSFSPAIDAVIQAEAATETP